MVRKRAIENSGLFYWLPLFFLIIMENVITGRKGNYILVMSLKEPTEQIIPKFGNVSLLPGHYYYCGSAHGNGGLKSRITRHLAKDSKRFWHIDYIKKHMRILEVWCEVCPENNECGYSHFFANQKNAVIPIDGFGQLIVRTCADHI
ncbi:MAG: GIY-YIG nuclease family protein [Pelolinea sp.]|nr:GIY-YIG nuclease family protein [Pelolinea sp.]